MPPAQSGGPDVRVVIDTNVAISGLLWHGKPRSVLEQARSGVITIFSSPALLDELADVLTRPHLASPVDAVMANFLKRR